MCGAGEKIHDDIDIAVRPEIVSQDRTEYLEFPDVPLLTKLLHFFLPAPDECVHDLFYRLPILGMARGFFTNDL